MAFLTKAANRGSIATGYEIENSLKLEEANIECINTPASYALTTVSNVYKGTTSFWIKRTSLNNGSGVQWFFNGSNSSRYDGIYWDANDKLKGYFSALGNGVDFVTTQVFRDTSAWYHIVMAIDTSHSTASERIKIYVNGEQITAWDTSPSIDQNTQLTSLGTDAYHGWGTNYSYNLGVSTDGSSEYLANCIHIDGQQLASTDFGEFDEDTGIWKPKEYTGTYGNKGYLLEFKSSSALGTDTSGNGNDLTNNRNITSADQATDTPTNNFCTLNSISYNIPYTASQGNTKWSKNDTTYGMASGTHYVGAGKWYWEIKATDIGFYYHCRFGIIDAAKPTVGSNEYGYEDPSLSANDPEILAMSGSPNSWYMNGYSTIANNGSTNSVDYSFYDGDILAFALDMDNGGYWMGSSRFQGGGNGSFWIAPGGTATSGSVAITDPTNGNYALVGDGGGTNNGTPNFNGGSINGGSLLTAGFTLVTPLLGAYSANTSATLEVNFGGFTSYGETGGYSDENGYGNFAYAVPSGFYCLCSKNIAEFGGTA